jgi:hypothetical protein
MIPDGVGLDGTAAAADLISCDIFSSREIAGGSAWAPASLTCR